MASTELLSIVGTGVYIAPMLGVMLTSTFWGRIGDKTGNKVMMIRALMGLALTQLGLAFANDVWVILLLRFLQGTCAGYIAPAQAYGIAMIPIAQRTRLLAWLQVSTNAGSLAGAIAGGAILDLLSFFWINFGAFIICTLCALLVFSYYRMIYRATLHPIASLPQQIKQKRYHQLTTASLLAYLPYWVCY